MSIDASVFMELIGELEIYYKRKFTDFVKRAWYRRLSPQMTTEQFQAAIESAVVSKQFMPTPDELIELVFGSPDVLALSDWELCVTAASRADRAMLSGMSPQGQLALRLIGGLHKLGEQETEQLVWTKKEFVAVWKSSAGDVNSLPQSRTTDYPQLDGVRETAEKLSLNGHKS